MTILKTILWIIEIISALSVIILVLLQHGKGADVGATFGSGGGSGSVFGASGSANFLSRMTAIFAALFFISTFTIVILSNGRVGDAGVMSGLHGKVIASGAATDKAKTSSSPTGNAAANISKSEGSSPVVSSSNASGAANSNSREQKNQMPN